jgi:hypothetical protein
MTWVERLEELAKDSNITQAEQLAVMRAIELTRLVQLAFDGEPEDWIIEDLVLLSSEEELDPEDHKEFLDFYSDCIEKPARN